MGTRAVLLCLGVGTGVVLARALGPEGRGHYTVAVTIATVAMALGHLSVEQAQISLWRDPLRRDGLIGNGPSLGLITGTAAALVTGAVLVAGLRWPALGLPDPLLLGVALASVPFTTASVYVTGTSLLRGRIGVVNRSRLGAAAVQCSALVLLAALGMLTAGWVVAIFTATALLQFVLLRPGPHRWNRSLARLTLRAGLPLHTGSSAFFLLQRVDILLLNALASPIAVGLYSVAVTVAEMTRLIADSVTQTAMPGLADADEEAAIRATRRATVATFAAALGSAGVLGGCAWFALPLVYGPDFAGSAAPLIALLPGLVLLAGTRPAGAWLLRVGRPHLVSATSVAGLGLNVALNLLLVPRFGAVGCALASTAGYGALALSQLCWFVHAGNHRLRAQRRVREQDAERRPEGDRDGEIAQRVGEEQGHQVGHDQGAGHHVLTAATAAKTHRDQHAERD
ncbi:O-antigen/teichoic acid export membrane protein [Allocatelliglobosispora scoriae]|uniref:O-antigen/teichoic acid export membrane protein n=1 Tax=Allocatelliglobosispora scoriae TaxID=643052 RepID=A0A841BUH1_9ACTN|nr:polysaccharide biosynthesis C-terminal domain-containing protein [Allocatelliglobosispora scoriae]MBB5870809.1 O-antigen/teichoic acid export membrane protein [Allocatelliglobosispora scoriae]